MNTRIVRILPVLFSTALLLAARAEAAAPRLADSSFEQRFAQLQQLARDSRLTAEQSAAVLALLDEAKASTIDQSGFLGATGAIAEQLLAAPSDYSSTFAEQYQATFQAQTEFKWDWQVNPLKKCDKNFNCVWGGQVCLLITWSDGHGSGGINCISPSVL